MRPSISTALSAEACRKAEAALAALGPFATASPPSVRWLLCGRGRPVDEAGASSPYTVVVGEDGVSVLYQDIERSRVEAEERWEELGYEAVPYPWYEPAPLPPGLPPEPEIERALAPLRLRLDEHEGERYRRAGRDCAEAMDETVRLLEPDLSEQDAAAELAFGVRRRGFFPRVVLVAGEERQPVHRHPLPTGAPIGAHALLALTAERDGLHVSLTRLVSFGRPPAALVDLVRGAAEVDAVMLRASRPGTTTGEVLQVAADAYEARGFPGEWRRHHQGGLTGYRGREVFATPSEATPLPDSCAVAWNPSITGGAKSEDTALVSPEGVEVITRTRELLEQDVEGLARPAIVEL